VGTCAHEDDSGPIRIRPAAKVTLDRSDLVFAGIGADRLRLEITLRNTADVPAAATTARISAAPFGAFVPWQPLLDLPVGAIPPRSTTTLRTVAARPRRAPRTEAAQMSTAIRLFLRAQGVRVSRREQHLHWAGNVDVFVHERAVERHVARLAGLVPGAVNVADFVVGGRLPDAYKFDFAADNDGSELRLQLPGLRGRSIQPSTWVELPHQQMLLLLARTPPHDSEGYVHEHVRQRSSGRDAVVEFAFAA
jgi:hypothetical protein